MALSLPSSITPGRCIVLLICLSLVVVLSASPSKPEVEPLTYHDVQFIPRQNNPSSLVPSVPVDSRTSTTTTTSQPIESSRSSNPTPVTPSTTSTTSETSTTSRQDPTSTTPPPQTTSSFSPPKLTSIQSTGADGSPTVVVVTVQVSKTDSSSPTPTPPPNSEANSSSGLGTGSIVGLSVAGGIALLGIAAFFIWKFSRKRRSSVLNDDDEIKWPDLNSGGHVPGVDGHTAPGSLSEHASIRAQSFQGAYGDGGLGASQSQVDLYAADPYAVPPLPHLNPNQPYRDDPNPSQYHDNFSAPAFHESRPSSPSIKGEAIPMNQINRSRSPGPQGALYTGHGGRQSPGPHDAYGVVGRQSPGPHDAYGGGTGRQSPGPHDAYGGGTGRQSPGPQNAYGGGYGRRSPGPNDAYGPR